VKISKSPQRGTFFKERYLQKCAENGENPDIERLESYDLGIKLIEKRRDDPNFKIDNIEYDLLTTDWILEKVRTSDVYAQNLYAAMCNNDFVKNDVWPILQDKRWSCSWRGAGGIIADMRQEGDYIDWYCSGMRSNEALNKYVNEGCVTDEIRSDLLKLGWIVIEEDK
jgi:hypothetical protein